MASYTKIRKKLEESLDEERFEHTLGVAKTAQFLSKFHNVDSESAYLAGLLHDCAKNISHKEKIKLCEKNNVDITSVEYDNPSLLHAKAGAVVAKKNYNIEDENILNAIRSHTTGRPGMSDLEKIVFIADYIEPGRMERPNLNEIRKLSVIDLNKTVIKILSDTLNYLKDSAKAIDPMTALTYEYYNGGNE